MKFWQTMIIMGLVNMVFVACVPPPPSVTSLKNFRFESPQSGAVISVNSQIVCEGSYSLPAGVKLADVHVWIVQRDGFRNYYLQNPPVELQSGGIWKVPNIRVGQGITQISAVQVNQSTHKAFVEKVEKNDWKAFTELPTGSSVLATVDITVR
jgi:hypothetical protein